MITIGDFTAFRAVEEDPYSEVVGKVLEAMLLTRRYE
jgi:hypothetical protein